MSEERQYEKLPRMEQEDSEEEEVQYEKLPRMEQEDYEEEESSGNEPRANPEYTKEEIEKFRAALKRTKCQILDCVLNILPPRLKAEAKRICNLTKENDGIWINAKKEVIVDGRVIPKSNICTIIIEELMKCQSPVNTKQYETENKLLKSLLSHQTKVLERERGVPLCKKIKSMFDGTVDHFDESDTDSDIDDDKEENSEDEEDEEDCHKNENDSDKVEDDEEDNTDETEDDDDEEDYEDEEDEPIRSKKRKKN